MNDVILEDKFEEMQVCKHKQKGIQKMSLKNYCMLKEDVGNPMENIFVMEFLLY
jgi:hypothetical protein